MSFEKYGEVWPDGALDMIPQVGQNVPLGAKRTFVVENEQGIKCSIHGEVVLAISIEKDTDKIDGEISDLQAKIARAQARVTELQARKAEIEGA